METAIAIGASFAAIVAAIFTGLQLYYQLVELNKQMMLQHFSDYTKRYQEILLRFPESVNDSKFDLSTFEPKEYDALMRNMRAYFDLCFEEWFLNRRSWIDRNIWEVWHGGMTTASSRPSFKQAWKIISKDSDFGEDFEDFLSGLQNHSKQQGSAQKPIVP